MRLLCVIIDSSASYDYIIIIIVSARFVLLHILLFLLHLINGLTIV